MTKEDQNNQFEKKYDGLLIEYNSLRNEIMKRQDARLYILAFTMAVVGTILGISFQDSAFIRGNSYLPSALGIFALVVILAAIELTTSNTQQNHFIATYIRTYIEPNVPMMRYETRWRKYCELKRADRFSVFPMSASRSLSITYVLLTASVCSIVAYQVAVLQSYVSIFVLIVILLATCCIILSVDLFFQKTRGWKDDLDILEPKKTKTKL